MKGFRLKGLEHDIALQVIQDLVVSKVGVGRQVEDGLLLPLLVILVVEDFNLARVDEVHLLHAAFVANNSLAWLVDTAVQTDDKLVNEPSLALLEEVVERPLELLELARLQN